MTVHLEPPSLRRATEFLAGVRRSRALHRGWVTPPRTMDQFRAYVARFRRPSHMGGVVNISEIVRGAFQSGYLGYYVLAPYDGRGHMTKGFGLVVTRAFTTYRLHRLEANIQPENSRSIALVQRLGFRLEGVSPRYLRIAGRWRDHERWALTVEDWKAARAARRGTAPTANRTAV